MPAIDRSTAELQNLVADDLKRSELELLGAVVAESRLGGEARLHAVGTNHLAVFLVLDDQVIANRVEPVAVEASRVGR